MSDTSELKELEGLMRLALRIGIGASGHALRYWPGPDNPLFDPTLVREEFAKGGGVGDYATSADLAVEAYIAECLAEARPDDGRFMEETDSTDSAVGSTGNTWVVDPIDGTIVFNHGMDQFAIAIGALWNGRPALGVIVLPALNRIFMGGPGLGVRLLNSQGGLIRDLTDQPRLVRPSDRLLVGYDTGYTGRGAQLQNLVAPLSGRVAYPVSYGACAYANTQVVQGGLDGYFHACPTIFDVVAATALVTGTGVVTDLNGQPIDWSATQRSYLAAGTPETHERILHLLQAA